MSFQPALANASFPACLPASSELALADPEAGSTHPMPAGAALRVQAVRELAQAAGFLEWRGMHRHEGATQARRAIRRTRAILELAHGAFGPDVAAIDGELKRISRALAAVRNGQALVDALVSRMLDSRSDGERELFERARQAACRRRDAAGRKSLRKSEGLSRPRIVQLAALVDALPWHRLVEADLGRVVVDNLVRADVAGRRASQGDDAREWHQWRRRARRVWQQTRMLASLQPLDPALVAGRHALARHLADAHRSGLILEHCRRHTPFDEDDRRALLEVVGDQLHRQRAAAVALL